ncbi:MAG: hypothetical protein K2G23_07245, partial [Muribaculaceae bacterium]|nr:hypothetical protein [Muribaculaceae bacterium]
QRLCLKYSIINELLTINFLIFKYHYLQILKVGEQGTNVICRLYGWIDEIIKRLVSALSLPPKRQYYLAKLKEGNDSDVKLYFLNDNDGKNNYRKSIFHYYWQDLQPEGNIYPDIILFPSTGISKRIMRKLVKYYNRTTRYMEI